VVPDAELDNDAVAEMDRHKNGAQESGVRAVECGVVIATIPPPTAPTNFALTVPR
jgi:hypothetical protein